MGHGGWGLGWAARVVVLGHDGRIYHTRPRPAELSDGRAVSFNGGAGRFAARARRRPLQPSSMTHTLSRRSRLQSCECALRHGEAPSRTTSVASSASHARDDKAVAADGQAQRISERSRLPVLSPRPAPSRPVPSPRPFPPRPVPSPRPALLPTPPHPALPRPLPMHVMRTLLHNRKCRAMRRQCCGGSEGTMPHCDGVEARHTRCITPQRTSTRVKYTDRSDDDDDDDDDRVAPRPSFP